MKVKTAQLVKVLSSNLRLLVLLRESLAASGADKSPLYVAVAAQAQLTGQVLPNSERMSKEETEAIRAQAGGALTAPEKVEQAVVNQKLEGLAKLPSGGEFQVLSPSTWFKVKKPNAAS
jgi:hypothetical protein